MSIEFSTLNIDFKVKTGVLVKDLPNLKEKFLNAGKRFTL